MRHKNLNLSNDSGSDTNPGMRTPQPLVIVLALPTPIREISTDLAQEKVAIFRRSVCLHLLSFLQVVLAGEFVLNAVSGCERGNDSVEVGFEEEWDARDNLGSV